MRALTESEVGVLTGLMGDDAPEGFAEEVMRAYGPGSGWEAAEAYGGRARTRACGRPSARAARTRAAAGPSPRCSRRS